MVDAMEDSLSGADRAYARLREMAADFTFRPEERLNETALSRTLGVSRTPLREALNRLAAEGFLVSRSGQGFFCRPLSPSGILDLYEARIAVECECARRACQRARDADIAALCGFLDETEPDYEDKTELARLLQMDEAFHTRIAALSGNRELARMLANLNDRIRYVRLVNFRMMRDAGVAGRSTGDARSGVRAGLAAHRGIADALRRRDAEGAAAALRTHIEQRREETTETVRRAFSQLYVAAEGSA